MPIVRTPFISSVAAALFTACALTACGSGGDDAAITDVDGGDDATIDTAVDTRVAPDTAADTTDGAPDTAADTADAAPADTRASDSTGGDTGDATTGDADARDTALVDSDARDSAIDDAASLAAAAHPPPRPSTTASGGVTKWFAVSHFYLGPTLPPGTLTLHSSWEHFGYDIDDRLTTASDSTTSTNSCRRAPGSPTDILTDAYTGGDNNYGAHWIPTLKSYKADLEDTGNTSLRNGVYTLLFRLDNVGPADNANVPGALFLAGPTTFLPTYTSADVWPITSDSLTDGATIASPKYAFPSGYMAGSRWVSGDAGAAPAPLALPFVGVGIPVPVTLSSTIISFRIDGAGGIISGAAGTAALKAALTPPLKAGNFCPGSAASDAVFNALTSSADLVLGAPSLQDVTVDCNAISIGLGFDASPTGTPTTVVPPLVMPTGSCP